MLTYLKSMRDSKERIEKSSKNLSGYSEKKEIQTVPLSALTTGQTFEIPGLGDSYKNLVLLSKSQCAAFVMAEERVTVDYNKDGTPIHEWKKIRHYIALGAQVRPLKGRLDLRKDSLGRVFVE